MTPSLRVSFCPQPEQTPFAQSASTAETDEPEITEYYESDTWKVTSIQSRYFTFCDIISQANGDTETGISFSRYGFSFMLYDTKFEDKNLGDIGLSVSVDDHPEWRFGNVGTNARNSSMEMAELYDSGQPFFDQLLGGSVLQVRNSQSNELYFTLRITGFGEASPHFFECIEKVFPK